MAERLFGPTRTLVDPGVFTNMTLASTVELELFRTYMKAVKLQTLVGSCSIEHWALASAFAVNRRMAAVIRVLIFPPSVARYPCMRC